MVVSVRCFGLTRPVGLHELAFVAMAGKTFPSVLCMNIPNIYWELFVGTVRFHQTVAAPGLLVVRLARTVHILLQILGDAVILVNGSFVETCHDDKTEI
jgi:hypothetical protein